MYVPPNNSIYYSNDYFNNIRIIFDTFGNNSYSLYFVGDLNTRIFNNYPRKGFIYKANPDTSVNQNGRLLINILEGCSQMVVVNGLIKGNISCDSNFTFYRGNTRSQNDFCITNNTDSIQSFNTGCPIKNDLSLKACHFFNF